MRRSDVADEIRLPKSGIVLHSGNPLLLDDYYAYVGALCFRVGTMGGRWCVIDWASDPYKPSYRTRREAIARLDEKACDLRKALVRAHRKVAK